MQSKKWDFSQEKGSNARKIKRGWQGKKEGLCAPKEFGIKKER